MATKTDGDTLKRRERVVAAESLPGIPEGTPGRVVMVSGFEWIRYWVRFENGVVRGSLDRRVLARPGEPTGDDRLVRAAAANGGGDAAAGGGEGAAASAGEGHEHAGVLIPAHLLERSKNRRAAIGA